MSRYYLLERGVRKGPYSRQRLAAKLDAGDVNGETLCVEAPADGSPITGLETWLPISTVIGWSVSGPGLATNGATVAGGASAVVADRPVTGRSDGILVWEASSPPAEFDPLRREKTGSGAGGGDGRRRRRSSTPSRRHRSGRSRAFDNWGALLGAVLVVVGAVLAITFVVDRAEQVGDPTLDPAALRILWKGQLIERATGIGVGLALAACGTFLLTTARDPLASAASPRGRQTSSVR